MKIEIIQLKLFTNCGYYNIINHAIYRQLKKTLFYNTKLFIVLFYQRKGFSKVRCKGILCWEKKQFFQPIT